MMRIRRYLALGARCVGGARALSDAASSSLSRRRNSLPSRQHRSWQAAGKGPKVSGAASASLKDGRVLLWGGLDEARNAVDSLYAFEDGAWTPVETTGFKPPKAMYAAAATQSLVGTSGKEEFVVCGGWDPGAKGSGGSFSDAVHALDVNKLEWQKDDPLPCGPVSRHAAATVGGSAEGRIYIHAFRDGVVRRDACGIAKSHKTTGQGPESLSMCAVAPVGDAGLLVVGGATKNGEFSDRAYVLDTKSYEWTELDAPDGPTARGSACCAALDASRVVFFGGAGKGTDSPGSGGLKAVDETWLLTVDGARGTWEQLDVAGPAARVAATLDALPDGRVLLSGGWDPATGGTFDDVWALEL